MKEIFVPLLPAERKALEDMVRGLPWWDLKLKYGIPAEVIKRATDGGKILSTTAEQLRNLIYAPH